MAEFEVTGVRYQMGDNLTMEETDFTEKTLLGSQGFAGRDGITAASRLLTAFNIAGEQLFDDSGQTGALLLGTSHRLLIEFAVNRQFRHEGKAYSYLLTTLPAHGNAP